MKSVNFNSSRLIHATITYSSTLTFKNKILRMSVQTLNVTPLINKVLDIIADGMLLLRTEQISADYSELYGFKIKLVLNVVLGSELNITVPLDESNKIQEQMDELMQILAEEIFEHNPDMHVELVSIDLDVSLTPKMWANFDNTTRH